MIAHDSITDDVVTVTINNLQCTTSYRFRVRGANDGDQLPGPYTTRISSSTSYVVVMLSGCFDLTRYVSAGQTYQLVSYPNYPYKPTITNGIGSYVYTYNPPLNEFYAVGIRQVTITAIDTMSCVRGSCQITISINEATVTCPQNMVDDLDRLQVTAPSLQNFYYPDNVQYSYRNTQTGASLGTFSKLVPHILQTFPLGNNIIRVTATEFNNSFPTMLTATCRFLYFRTGIICPSTSDISISSSSISFNRPAIVFPSTSQVSDIVYTNSANGVDIATLPFTQSTHILSDLETGMWVVRATATDADGNSASCQFSFMIGSTVNPPANVALDNVLTTSITFSWSVATCPDTCPDGITGYLYILLRRVTGIEVGRGTTGANERMVTISGLTPCTEYSFTVAGISGSQVGQYSDGNDVTTSGEAPDLIMIHTANPGETDITIQWQAPTTHCPVDRYIVEYRLVNRDQCQSITDSDRLSAGDFTTLSATIRNLLPFSTYEVYVRAVNDFGEGIEASILMTTSSQGGPSAAPSNVKLISSDVDSLSFSWDEVPCGSRHGVITGYYYQLIDDNGVIMQANTTNMQITFESGLLQCMRYQFKVSAGPQGNLAPFSDITEAITATSVVNLAVTALSSTKLKVSWEYPTESCTDSLIYQIEYRLTRRDQCRSVDNEFETYADSESGTSITLTKLLPHSTYEVRIIAGGSVKTEIGITNEEKPTGPPVGLEGSSISNTTLTFAWFIWNEPECTNRNGVITGYSYSLSETHTLTKTADNENTSKTSAFFTNLSPEISYTFVVSAKTFVGDGPTTTLTIVTDGTSSTDSAGQEASSPIAAIAGAVAGTITLLIVLLILFFVWRRQQSIPQTSPTSNETYDEIDPQIAQQSAIQNETGYEVNLAMEGIQTPKQYEGDELDYEDVKTKRESDYQGLNTGDIDTEHDYQGLGETEKKNQSEYQGLNKTNMDKEHDYQGLVQKSDTNRKTSSPYVNVS
ncbi:uncharacterized protein [Amphiura filiformis]|uniref:uncharacterized protein n=1 Tax=Amphiura filiformis TaxID=82378 RepID=UPI003B216FF3